jgi:hypothetical protein
MKYYKLSGSSEPKIIGVRNGVHQGEIKWKKFKNRNSEKEMINYFIQRMTKSLDNIEDISFEIEYVEAYKMAKMTDFFMFTPALYGINFFVSEKVRDLLSNYNMPVHTFLPVNIYQNEKLYKYWALYIPQFYNHEYLVFNECVFNQGYILAEDLVSYETYEEYKKSPVHNTTEKLVFSNKINKHLDLFDTSFIGHTYVISERLKQAIEDAGITGLSISDKRKPDLLFE